MQGPLNIVWRNDGANIHYILQIQQEKWKILPELDILKIKSESHKDVFLDLVVTFAFFLRKDDCDIQKLYPNASTMHIGKRMDDLIKYIV